MELPAQVLVHNAIMGLKGAAGTLLRIDAHGYYELNLSFGDKLHRALLPIEETVVIHRRPEETVPAAAAAGELEIER
ncbi:MAG: hypothetical protein AAGD01_17800 [Acidobacteriota bacterium]